MAAPDDMSARGGASATLDWVVLTRGDRPDELAAAVQSLRRAGALGKVVVVVNGAIDGAAVDCTGEGVEVHEFVDNLGVPGGRDAGLRLTTSSLVGFLDDDARLESSRTPDTILEQFAADPLLGAMSLRLVDENGVTARRHIPRRGAGRADESGPVATFLGGASVVRRSAYEQVGGYWPVLFYGHEELDLAWRLIAEGFWIRYEATARVFHPRTEIGRHADGWWRTGRNRVLIARRNLPAPILVVHTLTWLVIGVLRAPDGACRRGYAAGWRGGWSERLDRRPISWSAVGRLRRLGRLPIV